MTEVTLHVYDVTNSDSEQANNAVMQINRIFKDGIGLGGIFHSAIQVYGDEEWSFGFCEQGTGVFSCPPTKNTIYTYRESFKLGKTPFSIYNFNLIMVELKREWPGLSYDLLTRNCNHFCDAFCERLGVAKLPGWVNRFANAGDAAIAIAGNTAETLREATTEIVAATKEAYQFIAAGVACDDLLESPNCIDEPTTVATPLEPTWLLNLISPPTSPGSNQNQEEDDDKADPAEQPREDVETGLILNSQMNI